MKNPLSPVSEMPKINRPKIAWKKGKFGESAEVVVSVHGGPISYDLHVSELNDGTYDFWLVEKHFILLNGQPARTDSLSAPTLKEAKARCEEWMRQEVRKIILELCRFV